MPPEPETIELKPFLFAVVQTRLLFYHKTFLFAYKNLVNNKLVEWTYLLAKGKPTNTLSINFTSFILLQ